MLWKRTIVAKVFLGPLLPLSNVLIIYALKTKPTFNYVRKLEAKTKYFPKKRTIGL